jgi:hypothetical protein
MVTPTPTHRCQPKGSIIAFHCIATVSGFLMITCVLATIKSRSHFDTHKQMCQLKIKRCQVWLSHWTIWGGCLPVFQFGGFASMGFIGNWWWVIHDPNIQHAEIMYVQQIQSDTWFQDRACGIYRQQIQGDSGKNVNILKVESMSHFEKKSHMNMCLRQNG